MNPPPTVDSLGRMEFSAPAPDLSKMITAWEEWERGEQAPGKVLASLKTAGLDTVLRQLAAQGWSPSAS